MSSGKKQIAMSDKWRDKIKASNILKRLIQCGEGTLELDRTQAMVGLRLIDKILPSLQAVQVEQTIHHVGLTRVELDARLIALGHNPHVVWNNLEHNQEDKPDLSLPGTNNNEHAHTRINGEESNTCEEGSTPEVEDSADQL